MVRFFDWATPLSLFLSKYITLPLELMKCSQLKGACNWETCAIIEDYLTIRLQARVFYEQ